MAIVSVVPAPVVVAAVLAAPVAIAGPSTVVDGDQDAGRERQHADEGQADQTDKASSVVAHECSPHASFPRGTPAENWTFAGGPRSNTGANERRLEL